MKEYKNEDGKLHRVNGPALVWNNGDYVWMYNGVCHRYYGVACHFYNYYYQNEYYIFDEGIK